MLLWRGLVLAGLIVLAGTPLLFLLLEVLKYPVLPALTDLERLLGLLSTTGLLCLGVVVSALPVGVLLALLLHRTDLPGRGFFRFLLLGGLFIPLPVQTSAWQAALGTGGWLPTLWPARPGQPWAEGMGPAIWVHALAGLPWVVLIVGFALQRVEVELEEEALLAVPPWRVLWLVTLPRCQGALLLAGLWLVFSTAGEITVVYLFQIPTFAEEIHTIFSAAGAEALAQAIVVSLLPVPVLVPILLVLLSWLRRGLPLARWLPRQPRPLLLGRWRHFLALLVGGGLGLAFGIPLVGLVWKVGLSGTPSHWSLFAAGRRLFILWQTDGLIAAQTLLTAASTGILTATLALLLAWAVLDHPWLRLPAVCLLLLFWMLPGPVIGLGLKAVIQRLVEEVREPLLSWLLYDGPSPVPVMWAHGLRVLPLAAGILWVGLRQVPRELREAAALEGAAPLRELVRVIVPASWPAWLAAVVLVLALALGEVSAGKLVETPGWETLSRVIFDRMHYGVAEDVAGLCLLLLGLAGGGGLISGWVRRWGGQARSS